MPRMVMVRFIDTVNDKVTGEKRQVERFEVLSSFIALKLLLSGQPYTTQEVGSYTSPFKFDARTGYSVYSWFEKG